MYAADSATSYMNAPADSWVSVVGYQHEVLHTGVLAALLQGTDGPTVAARLTQRDSSEIADVHSVAREKRLPSGKGRADLTAELELVDGRHIPLAVETKIHSNGTCRQLERTTMGVQDAEGVLLALGLTSLKLTRRHIERGLSRQARWHWVGVGELYNIVNGLSARDRPWLPSYAEALRTWKYYLDPRQQVELKHLEWMNRVLQRLSRSTRWNEIKSLRSGPLLSRFDWCQPGRDVYLEFMGSHDGRRFLCIKCSAENGEDLVDLEKAFVENADQLPAFHVGGRAGGKSRTVLVTDDFGAGTSKAVQSAAQAVKVLDSLFGGR